MNALTVFFFVTASIAVKAQVHYVPAQILIPTLNISSFQGLPNGTSFNNNQPSAPVWNQPTFNATGYNRTGWNNPALNRTVFNGTTDHGDLILGQIGYLDRLLFNQEYYKPGRWWSGREKKIEYPQDVPGGYVRHETIAAIRVYNKFYDGVGATAKVTAGGVGSRYVKIKLESNFGKGFKYLVQIFGH